MTPNGLKIVTVKEIDGGAKPPFAVEGVVVGRCDYRRGGGFHIRLKDGSGMIDVKFWNSAAEAFRGHSALQRNARLRLAGFYTVDADERYAPPGRRLELRYNQREGIDIQDLGGLARATEPQKPRTVSDVLRTPGLLGTEVDVEATILVAAELERKLLRSGDIVDFRELYLVDVVGPDQQRLRWALWEDSARRIKAVRKKVRIMGAVVKDWGTQRQLTGGKRIEVLD